MSRKLYRRFKELELEVIWAAVERLDVACMHLLYDALTEMLFVEPHLRADGPAARESRAVLALREAAKILGHSSSIAEFAELLEQHPEYGWPHPSRVRAWLGAGSWNRALERAGLEVCAVDAVVRERVGSRFSNNLLIGFLKLAAVDLGGSFTFEQYSHWARRPDVVAMHGLVARSIQPFIRAFGSWSEAFAAAGLREAHVVVDKAGRPRSARHRYPRAEIVKALRVAAETIGRTPAIVDYKTFRQQLWQERSILLPSAWAIRRPFGDDWGAACVAAGLEHPGTSVTAEFTDEELLEFVAQAVAAGCTTPGGYEVWRAELRAAAQAAGKNLRVPSAAVIRTRFGDWRNAVNAAIARAESGEPQSGNRER